MKYKDGVKLGSVKPQVALAIVVVNSIYESFGKELVVTSVADGKHKKDSKHYDGNAFDCRTFYFMEEELPLVHKDIIEALTDEFDVVLEKDHFHIEFDPK